MNIRQLACFVAVVEEGSFTRAARRIGITQPSLSQHIRALELDIDGPVIERLSRGITLTPAGALAPARGARRGSRGRAWPACGALAALAVEAGELEMATVLSMAVGLLPRSIRQWRRAISRRRDPAAGVHPPALLEDAVEKGVADFAIGPLPLRDWAGAARGRWGGRSSSSSCRGATRSPGAAGAARGARRPGMGALPAGSRARGRSSRRSAAARVQPARHGAAPPRQRPRHARRGRLGPAVVPDNIVPARNGGRRAAARPADDPRRRACSRAGSAARQRVVEVARRLRGAPRPRRGLSRSHL